MTWSKYSTPSALVELFWSAILSGRRNVRLFRASPQWVRPASLPANARLESLRLPLLVLMGAADPTESNEAGRVLLERVAGAMGRTFPVCGHLVPLDCPESTRGEIQNFLARL